MSLKQYLKKMISKPTSTKSKEQKVKDSLQQIDTAYGSVTPEQNSCIEFQPKGNLLVRGIPGSGKSTVLLARAQYLEEKSRSEAWKGPKVLVLSYNRALATYMRFLCKKNGSAEVETQTFHQWGLQLLGDRGLPITICADPDTITKKVRFAYNTIKKHKPESKFPKLEAATGKAEAYAMVDFLEEEFSWIKGMGIKDRQEYIGAARIGRGNRVQVTKEHKQTIYDVFEKYNEMMKSIRRIDFNDVAILLLENLDKIPSEERPLHILVDEAQDLTLMQLKALKELATESLTIAADKGQQIYRRAFSWKAADIEIHKGNSKFLTFSFRSTKQIIQLARSLQQHDTLLKKDDEYVASVDPITEGPVPELIESNNLTEEVDNIVNKITQIHNQYPNDSIGLIATNQKRLDQFGEALEQTNIPYVFVKEEFADITSPGVKLVSIHSSKGLEFDHNIVSGLKEGRLPYKKNDPDEDEEEFLSRERRKLYVAMTRGKLTLTLSSVKKPSRFIDELDPSLYKRV